MNIYKQRLLDFLYDFSQINMKYFLDKNDIKSSNFYVGKISEKKLEILKNDIINKIEELEMKYHVY